MTRRGPSVILCCLLSWAAAFYHLILFAFLKPDVQAALSIGSLTIRWIDGITFAAAAAGGFALGRAADRGARRLVVALTPVIPAIGSLVLASAQGAPAVVAARLLVGFGVGGGWGVGHAIIGELYEGRKRLRAAAILQTGGPLGVIVAALAGSILVPPGPDGWRSVLAWSSLTAAIAALDPWAMRGVGRLPAREAPDAADAPVTGAARPALLLFGLLALQMTAYWCTFGWLPTHLAAEGVPRARIGWMQMAIGGVQALADLGFGWLSPKVGLRRLFAACNVAFGVGVTALAVLLPSVSASPAALFATICAIGLGSGSWAAFGPLYARYVPASRRSSVSSLSYHLARASQLVVQPAVGLFGGSGASQVAALLTAAAAAWAGALAIQALRRD